MEPSLDTLQHEIFANLRSTFLEIDDFGYLEDFLFEDFSETSLKLFLSLAHFFK